nr:hypothetical protein A6C57_17410 [Fibrella sp. ES10-3-2-2]
MNVSLSDSKSAGFTRKELTPVASAYYLFCQNSLLLSLITGINFQPSRGLTFVRATKAWLMAIYQ